MTAPDELWFMFADEADQDGSTEYLVSAATFIPASQAGLLHQKLSEIRSKYGFSAGDSLKFATSSKPEKVSAEQHKLAKNDTLELASELGCKCCLYLTPHSIAKGASHDDRLKWAYNTQISQFNWFLKTRGHGMVFLDRTTDFDQFSYLQDVFKIGLDFKGKRKIQENIIAAIPSSNNSSHFSSVADVVTGAFRWVVNEPEKDNVGAALWKALANLIWIENDAAGRAITWDRGFCLRPKTRAVLEYEADCRVTVSRLNEYWSR